MKTEAALSEFLHSRQAQNLSQLTIDFYRAKLKRFADSCPKLPKDPRPIEAFLATVLGSKATRLNYFNALSALFKFISERYKKVPNPMVKMRPPRLSEEDSAMATLEPEEAMRLLDSVPRSNLRDQAILTLLVDSGIRSSELARLRRQDLKGEIIQVYGKSGKHYVPISEETRRLLLSLIAEDSKDDYVFHGHKGLLTRHGVYRIVSGYMRKAGIPGPKLGPHRVRHGFGKGFLVMGGDTRSLQKIMGHKKITTTEKYVELALTDIIAKHHEFTPLRAAHAAAQQSFFDKDKDQAVKEAEEIVKERGFR